MIAEADAAGADWTLLYGGRKRSSMAFLDELERHGEKVTVWPQDTHGLLDLDALLGTPRPDALVYACGPGPLLDAVEARCGGWPEGALHIERFAAAPLSAPVRDEPFEVELARTGRVVTVPTDRSIVDVVEAETGMTILTSCSEGKCGTCETGVLEGTPDHRDVLLTQVERAACDRMMICVSRSCSARLVLDL
jgi:ferredoxin